MSNVNLIPPTGLPPLNHPPAAVEEGVKQILCSPESAAVKVKRPLEDPRWFTTLWS